MQDVNEFRKYMYLNVKIKSNMMQIKKKKIDTQDNTEVKIKIWVEQNSNPQH